MDTKHTPGPWVSEGCVDEWGLSVIASDDANSISTPSRGQVCHVSIVAGASGNDEENAKANARLIAAAPELLEALEPFSKLIDVLELMGGNTPKSGTYLSIAAKDQEATITIEDLKAARAAIAKATQP